MAQGDQGVGVSLTLTQASLQQVAQACRGSEYGQDQEVGRAGPCARRRWC